MQKPAPSSSMLSICSCVQYAIEVMLQYQKFIIFSIMIWSMQITVHVAMYVISYSWIKLLLQFASPFNINGSKVRKPVGVSIRSTVHNLVCHNDIPLIRELVIYN